MLVVGVDIGTQSLKAVVVDEGLAVLGESQSPYRPTFPRPGWAEQDPALWEGSIGGTIAGALAAAGRRSGDVAGIGLAGQLDGCIATDASGRALAPALIWMDRRANAEIEDVPARLVRERTGVVLDSTHMAAKIRWLSLHEPRARAAARFHQPVSYMVARLTGEHVFDHGLASTTMLYDLHRRTWDADLLGRFAIDPNRLPRLADADEPAGGLTVAGAAITGLPEGIPVAVGTGDDFSNPLGAGLVAPGRLACTLGTAEVVGALDPRPLIDGGALVETHAYVGRQYFIENPGWLSGGAVTWAAPVLGLPDVAALDRLAGTAPPGCEGVTFLPALSGAMAPEWIAGARGCWYGLTPAHGSGHLARAILEGCAFAMRDVADRLRALGLALESVLLLGGGARSRLWAAMRADMLGLPLAIPRHVDASPIGAAVLGAVAARVAGDVVAAARRAGAVAATIEPDPSRRAVYDEAYGRYQRLFASLRPMFETPS
jgi:xylulokinase